MMSNFNTFLPFLFRKPDPSPSNLGTGKISEGVCM